MDRCVLVGGFFDFTSCIYRSEVTLSGIDFQRHKLGIKYDKTEVTVSRLDRSVQVVDDVIDDDVVVGDDDDDDVVVVVAVINTMISLHI